jgi:hypothetical protein
VVCRDQGWYVGYVSNKVYRRLERIGPRRHVLDAEERLSRGKTKFKKALLKYRMESLRYRGLTPATPAPPRITSGLEERREVRGHSGPNRE